MTVPTVHRASRPDGAEHDAAAVAEPAVAIRGLRKSYGDNEVVRGIDLDIPAGAFVSVLGPSGSGKTTVLRSVAGLERPSSGRISLAGRTVFDAHTRTDVTISGRDVGVIFQNYALWPHKTVLEHVLYPLNRGNRRIPRDRRHERALSVLGSVGLLGLEHRHPFELSGGQQQRVAVARAIAAHPPLLLMDEPFSNLDVQLRARLRRELRAIHESTGATSLYVTHDQEEAFALSDHVVLVHNGIIVQQGTPLDVYRSPATQFAATFLGFENLFEDTTLAGLTGRSVDQLRAEVPAGTRQQQRGPLVTFRSEAVQVGSAGEHLLRLGDWTVTEVEFTGGAFRFDTARADRELVVTIPAATRRAPGSAIAAAVRVGDTIELAVDPAELVFVDAD